MRLDRISLQLSADDVRAFDLHRGLTVVESEPGGEHQLATALLGTLRLGRAGVHVEFGLDDGRSLVAFRPEGAPHRVIDIDSHADVTDDYRRSDGSIDVLWPWRPGYPLLERDQVVGPDELLAGDPTEQWVSRLAALDPDDVIATAEREVAAEQELRRATAAARLTPEAAARQADQDRVDQANSTAQRKLNRLRVGTLVVGSGLPLGGVALYSTIGPVGALTMIGGSVVLTTGCLLRERQLARSLESNGALGEDAPSADTDGAEAVNGVEEADGAQIVTTAPKPLDPEVREALLEAADRYQRAASAWQQLAGTIPAPWVVAERERIVRAAQLRAEVLGPGGTDAEPLSPVPAASALMAGLTARAAASITGGSSPEALPLFLEHPLEGLTWTEKAPVLEYLGRLSRERQLVLVTADPEVLAWARLEAMTGSLGAITSPVDAEEVAEPMPTEVVSSG